VIALYAGGIYELVATASAFGSAGIFVVGMFGLFSRVGGPRSAYAALLAGMGVWAAGEYLLEWPTPYVAALAAALLAYLAGADRLAPSQADARV
jgi:Na+/proline symporter